MDPFFGRLATVANLLVYIMIRWPHGNRRSTLPVDQNRRGRRELWLLIGAGLGTTLIPVLWVVSGFPSAADYTLHPASLVIGIVLASIGNVMFYRAHHDLGLLWSPTLETREDHRLVAHGIYARIRHPMYSAMFAQGLGQLFYLPNWIAGPAWLVSFTLLYVFRVHREEQMMLDRLGSEYGAYMSRTGRLIPRFGRK